MFEVIEHLSDAPKALRIAWSAVDCIVGSFPNPVHHGSWMNKYDVNDWSLDQFERELREAASDRFFDVGLMHYHQPVGSPLLVPGRDPGASFWVVVASGRSAVTDPAVVPDPVAVAPPAAAERSGTGAVRVVDSGVVSIEGSIPPAVKIEPDMRIRDYWLARAEQHTNDRYLGIKTSKFPEDLRVYEHLLWAQAPDIVVEIGAQSGGSTLWFRDRLRTLQAYGAMTAPRVIAVDIDLTIARENIAARDPAFAQTITFVEGDVCDPDVRAAVGQHVPAGANCFVIEDSAHVEDTTRAALEFYTDLVPPAGFFVVEDGCVDIEWMRIAPDWPRGVLPAFDAWLATDAGRRFRVRRDLEAYGISCHPSGFLQRVS